jgi:GH18 family chitinase
MKELLKVVIVICGLSVLLAGCGDSSATGRAGPQTFSFHYAGTCYPIYNSGAGQWIEPADSMPFDKVSTIFEAFAHACPEANGAVIAYEQGQPEEPFRLAELGRAARRNNSRIKILISLGWGKDDWDFIAKDYANNANLFVPSVVQFIRDNAPDGLDIDDEDIGEDGESGNISQADFDGVIAKLRETLDVAASVDNRKYYLTITPAGNNDDTGGLANTQVSARNAAAFDLINIQSCFDSAWSREFFRTLKSIHFPLNRFGAGIDTEKTACAPSFPVYQGIGGLFDWNMTADSKRGDFKYTRRIARLVAY